MATSTEHRTGPKTGAESEFDRGVGSTPYKTTNTVKVQDGSNAMWAVLVAALVILGAGYFYYTSQNTSTATTPAITETVTPPPAVTPDPATPPVVAPSTTTPPAAETTTPPAADAPAAPATTPDPAVPAKPQP